MILTPEERRAVVALAVLLVFGQAVSWWEKREASRPDRELSAWLTDLAELRAAADSVPQGLPGPGTDVRAARTLSVRPRNEIPPGILETGKLRVNEADAEQLETLSGVGPALARRIVEARAERPFSSVDDLRRVSGIGPRTLERLRPQVEVSAPGSPSDPS